LVLLLLGAAVIGGTLAYRPARTVVRGAWSQLGVRRVEQHVDVIRIAAAESNLDPNLMGAIMYAESRGRVDAVSRVGALGLFQLMESSAGDSARRLGLEKPTREQLLTDATLNARLAASHLAWLIEHEGPDLEAVLVAYNAGRAKLHSWVRKHGSYEAWREKQERDGDSQVLAYARHVLGVRDHFAERGQLTVE
jgi:soluble lytic murein transglycosylase-like protein